MMEDIVEFILTLLEPVIDALDILENVSKYWRFWLPIGIAGLATWGVTSLVSNRAMDIAICMCFMLVGFLSGIFLQANYASD